MTMLFLEWSDRAKEHAKQAELHQRRGENDFAATFWALAGAAWRIAAQNALLPATRLELLDKAEQAYRSACTGFERTADGVAQDAAEVRRAIRETQGDA